MRVKIRLDTNSDLLKFIRTVTAINEDVTVDDGAGNRVSAKSLLGCAYAKMEFEHIYCECDKDISGKLLDFII
jgi:hypothetical protein